MADSTNIHAHLATLSTALDALTTALAPLLTTPPTTLAATLPPRDAARLHVLAVYAPESLLFNAVRLAAAAGAAAEEEDPKRHPVVGELARVHRYAARLRDADAVRRGPALRVDREAARRFVRAGIAPPPKEDEEKEMEKTAVEPAEEAPSRPGAAKRGLGREEGVGAGATGEEDAGGKKKKRRKDDRRDGGTYSMGFWRLN
jgi:exosome complex protein LRP1